MSAAAMDEEEERDFHPVLFDTLGKLWLVHCFVGVEDVHAAVVVAEPGLEGEWQILQDGMGVDFYGSIPAELLDQGTRVHGLDVTFPISAIPRSA